MSPEEAFEEVRKRTFRLQTAWAGKTRLGTAFMLFRLYPSNRIVVATAAHVLDFPDDAQVTWSVRSIAEDGTIVGECGFKIDEAKTKSRPYSVNKHADVGFCVLPPPEQEWQGQLVADNLEALGVISEDRRLAPGTRVAWAGFPGQVEHAFRQPLLCYFEGVVSAFHNVGGRGRYLIDGHNAFGVSGGPVWHWPENGTGIEIAGIVSGYATQESDMPGYCIFEPINPVVSFVKSKFTGKRIEG